MSEDLGNKIEWVKHRMRAAVAEADSERAKLAAKMQESNHAAVYHITWMQGLPRTLILGALCKECLNFMEGHANAKPRSQEQWVQDLSRHYGDELRRWSPQHSTNPFSNVVHEDRFEALKLLLEILEEARL